MDKLTPGTKVTKGRDRYEGVVLNEYLPDMYEVKLRSGVIVCSSDELTRQS